uniref:Serine and arginine rich splicing factor 11 n=1 Tax=Neogobius melanostomus TaxID=47308 RepID=A0A8C6S9K7_9GOBI
MNTNTHVIQVTNVSPSTTAEQMRTLLFPPDDSPLPVTSRVCFVKFLEPESVGVSQHLTNTVFVDRALIVVPFAEGVIPDESKAMSLLAPANAVAGMMPGGGLLPTPNSLAAMGMSPFGGLAIEQMAAMGFPGHMNSQALSADFLKLMQSIDPKLNPLAAGLGFSPGLKTDASSKDIEEAMKRVREAQSLISAKDKDREKERDRREDKERGREERERSVSKKKKSKDKDKERDREHKSDSEKGDVKVCLYVTRNYDEEEQGYGSEKEAEEEDDERKSDSASNSSPKGQGERANVPKKSKLNGDDHHHEDMEMSD